MLAHKEWPRDERPPVAWVAEANPLNHLEGKKND